MWLIELSGDQTDIEKVKEVAKVFECDIASDHDGRAWLSSATFDHLSAADEVQRKAIELLRLLNGAGRILLNLFRPVQFAAVSRKRPDGTKAHFTAASFAAAGRFPGGENAMATRCAEQIRDDPKLREIADALADQISWPRLRVVFEKVCALITGRSDNWDNKLVQAGYATTEELTRLKANTEDPRLSGLDAVHGVPKGPRPRGSKMTELEGLQFVRRLLNDYLDRQP